MRLTWLSLVGALLAAASAEAGLLPDSWDDRVQLHFKARLRGEFVDWFRPAPTDPPVDNDYAFFGSHYRFGMTLHFPHARLVVEGQETILANVPTNAVAPAPIGALGPGGVYFLNTAKSFQQEPFLKKGFLELRHRGLLARLGRFEISGGFETVPTNPSLAFLKKTRIAERLVGPFGFTHVTRSFDAGLFSYDRPGWNVTAYGSRVTQGGFEISANKEISDMTLAGASVTAKQFSDLDMPFDGSVFYVFYEDGRTEPVKVDNRPLPERRADLDRIRIHTAGTHGIALWPLGPGQVDALFWGALQGGEWGELSHFGWSFAAEAGYQLPGVWGAPWLRVGADRSSGDPNPNDDRHETFFQILPTARRYARLPFYDLMNTQDVFASLILKPHARVDVRSDYHWLGLTESADLWYQGGGATNDRLFGYSGTPSGGSRQLAHLVDISIGARILPQLFVEGYVGHAFGQGVIGASFEGRGATYAFVETVITF